MIRLKVIKDLLTINDVHSLNPKMTVNYSEEFLTFHYIFSKNIIRSHF